MPLSKVRSDFEEFLDCRSWASDSLLFDEDMVAKSSWRIVKSCAKNGPLNSSRKDQHHCSACDFQPVLFEDGRIQTRIEYSWTIFCCNKI
jgi:hypothetical protein